MEKSKKLKIMAGVVSILFLGSVFGGYKVIKAKKFNDLVNSGNNKFKIGNYDAAIASYSEALQIKDDNEVKNQILVAKSLKVFLSKSVKTNEKSVTGDKEESTPFKDAEGNAFDGFTEEEKKILAQVSNININDPVVNGYDGTTSNNISSNKKNYSYTTQKNVQKNTKVNTSNVSSAAGNINTSSNSSSNNASTELKSSQSTSSSNNTSAESNNSQSTDSNSNANTNPNTNSNSGANKEARIQALYQQEQIELAAYSEKINELRQKADQLAQEANALPENSTSKADLLKKKTVFEQQLVAQVEECKRVANDYLQKVNAIQNE
ncbi:hypothetical protein [Clostridium sp. OS1-26]|uniref:hypothetical protein n=1 Tax=Clostridium sp. OS1-26 TaxID=3070681 RepID=UPI0027E1850C|nr:hypothetical protein [Clostridium sp. OS1-26]WML34525.1 hypothetical protein RCG18_25140 [Clostridium sp. OS1-26]